MAEEYVPRVVGGLEMEVDKRKGVLYLHRTSGSGETAFRMCKIPGELLGNIPVRARGIVLIPSEDSGELEIATEGGMLYMSIGNVPESVFAAIRRGYLADIIVGHHPVTIESGFVG